MRQWVRTALLSLVFAAASVLVWEAHVVYAGNNLLGNGFPSGPHFNLVILGKKEGFTCPTPADYLAGTPDQNVIYVPRVGDDISILMESGAKGPKNNPTQETLKVTDWCSQTLDGDAATVMLPKSADGYAVFGRMHGKPGDDGGPTFQFTSRQFDLVQDEFGNDLIALGLITGTGIEDLDGNLLQRWDGSGKGKGVLKAKDITAIFQYTGTVCAINDTDTLCLDGGCTVLKTVCCAPLEDSGDGTLVVASSCEDPDLVGFGGCVDQIDGACPAEIPYGDGTTTTVCPVDAMCKELTDAWIFNVADFVNVLYNAENDGSYNIQLRFYKLPLINNQ